MTRISPLFSVAWSAHHSLSVQTIRNASFHFGQGAPLLAQPEAASNPFFLMLPSWSLWPMIGLATIATVIASQAVISGAFSLANQRILLGFLPTHADSPHLRHRTRANLYAGRQLAAAGTGDFHRDSVSRVRQSGSGLRYFGNHNHANYHEPAGRGDVQGMENSSRLGHCAGSAIFLSTSRSGLPT